MIGWLTAIGVALAVAAIYGTTARGQQIVRRLGWHRFEKGAAEAEDRAYLLRVCEGDRASVEGRLQYERDRFPDLDEAAIHRRAIRTYMNAKSDPAPDADGVARTGPG